MKNYIFFTTNIKNTGGAQLYIDGKAKFLEKKGYRVFVFFASKNKGTSPFSYLNKYIKYGLPIMRMTPEELPKILVDYTLNIIENYIGDKNDNEYLIESNESIESLWAERLAYRLKCKHIIFSYNEQFVGENKVYKEYLVFFEYKYKRNELYLNKIESFKLLFGDNNLKYIENHIFDPAESDPIDNVENKQINSLNKKDYNILYLGRSEKGYVPNIIQGINDFSLKHKGNTIRFIMIGDADCRKEQLKKMANNVEVVLLGNLVPIPKSIYEKVDVVIAGSVCAEVSARQMVPVIVADCVDYVANGVLGYTVFNSLYKEGLQTSFEEALEDVLINKEYSKHKFSYDINYNRDEIYGDLLEKYNHVDRISNLFNFKNNILHRKINLVKYIERIVYTIYSVTK